MVELVSKIPKEKVKVGKLYKTQAKVQSTYRYRVWLGDELGWSIGTLNPCVQNHPSYQTATSIKYDHLLVLNTKATPFKLGVWEPIPPVPPPWKKSKKEIRYLNRPQV